VSASLRIVCLQLQDYSSQEKDVNWKVCLQAQMYVCKELIPTIEYMDELFFPLTARKMHQSYPFFTADVWIKFLIDYISSYFTLRIMSTAQELCRRYHITYKRDSRGEILIMSY